MATSDVDAYIEVLDEPKRGTLEEMRRRILEVIPDAEQKLSYAVPAFTVGGKVVAGLAAFKTHLSYLPHSGSVLGGLAAELSQYERTKGALHFPIDEPLPRELIRSLIDAKLRLLADRSA
jgi:uncharacterized protein YdhG (YjbR/CyaY superfamily)